MTEQPRLNERSFRYPTRRVTGIMDHDSQVATVVERLPDAGVDVAAVNILSGPEGVRLLDRSGARHGRAGRLLRRIQRSGYESAALDIHHQALNSGRHVIYVPVGDADQAVRVAAILREAGASYLLYFRRWSIEQMMS